MSSSRCDLRSKGPLVLVWCHVVDWKAKRTGEYQIREKATGYWLRTEDCNINTWQELADQEKW